MSEVESTGQAGAQIEITPEILNEGAQIIENQCDTLPSLARDIALEVFRAMMNKMLERLDETS